MSENKQYKDARLIVEKAMEGFCLGYEDLDRGVEKPTMSYTTLISAFVDRVLKDELSSEVGIKLELLDSISCRFTPEEKFTLRGIVALRNKTVDLERTVNRIVHTGRIYRGINSG